MDSQWNGLDWYNNVQGVPFKKRNFSATEHFGVNISETVQILVERQIAG